MKIFREVDVAEIEDMAAGGAVLGTGGGGDPYIGKLMAQQAIRKFGKVKLVRTEDLPDDALVVPVCMMGAPTVMTEKLPQGDELVNAFVALEKLLGRKIDAVLCGEAGGVNSMTPFVVAAATGLPLVDGDGMGRAFPELQMETFALAGVSATPMVLCDDKGNTVTFETVSNRWTERLARAATVEMGGSALLAFYSMSGAKAKECVVRGTLTLCESIGRTLREAKANHGEPVKALASLLQAHNMFEGRIVDIERRTVGGFARGKVILNGTDDWKGHEMSIDFQNEFLLAMRDGEVVVTTPDLISLVDAETGLAVTTDSLRYGQRLVCLAYPCNPMWRTPLGIEVAGPRYFKYDVDYQPLAAAE
ncbi:DUF917 domain-containing protein [Ketogulonicigenium vulgare]|uniref:DUF917 domain-containing protein n=1 Tax=Ketogulonicigenium vulgare (strain WSH-001) TaxID=759362 RepID=F9Y9I2_KETVW|nr:DUF917 domain-containing protein [Ketogulonicigenium vulgare]AEM40164.1 hypothetical protein KVU_0325 [Ketogulonicigenium vulgare WSH-001]ALJ80371.1 hypothetical protein KVH_03750 [Ketogulonicigenium vulgare]ANW33205.1 hypothetical protein KvSKV_03725 [Ketogulonicigenium vulgare]AOZ53865.1 hypothetical protein KVC_0848 [Ketogulonicigenium vulgare]